MQTKLQTTQEMLQGQVAKQNGVSVKEVRKDLEEMIKVVMS